MPRVASEACCRKTEGWDERERVSIGIRCGLWDESGVVMVVEREGWSSCKGEGGRNGWVRRRVAETDLALGGENAIHDRDVLVGGIWRDGDDEDTGL